jgi:hypothetical protein
MVWVATSTVTMLTTLNQTLRLERRQLAEHGRLKQNRTRQLHLPSTSNCSSPCSLYLVIVSRSSVTVMYRAAFSGHCKPLSFYTASLPSGKGAVNYRTAVSTPSPLPPRKICSVCGFSGAYTCSRCGSRFCGIHCQDVHKETKCVRF